MTTYGLEDFLLKLCGGYAVVFVLWLLFNDQLQWTSRCERRIRERRK